MKNKKVLLGMSGGVDSSVSALLLKKQGFEVLGITLNLYGDNTKNVQDAKKVCEKLDIKHISYDLEDKFKKYVIDDFIHCYKNAMTPNPCIECNRYIKFGAMYDIAKEFGCEYIATGHYAKVEYSKKYQKWVLKKSDNYYKDQSYVLWNIPKDILEHVIFPLSNFESKDEIRKIAKENGLEVAEKKDSEDICFVPDGNYKEFLEKNSDIVKKEGDIVNLSGAKLGRHNGLYNYTIGQRKGLKISYKEPLFVLGFNKEKNQVIVDTEKNLYKREAYVNNINLLLFDEIKEKMEVNVKTRYTTKDFKAIIYQENDKIKIEFLEDVRAITPGQSAVFYLDDIVVGGGKII